MSETTRYYETGKRKSAVARVWLIPGSGQVTVNKLPLESYFPLEIQQSMVREPFNFTDTTDQFDALVTVRGGGVSGQAGAIRHGVAKALLQVDPEYRVTLKQQGFLTRDPRVKERKKYGQKKARKRFQYSKR